MKAITIPVPGDADALVLADVPAPEPGPAEVLVTVAAAGVNRADLMQRQGFYDPPPGASAIPRPGGERHGRRRRRRGAGLGGRRRGVRAAVRGGYAEQVVVPAGQLLPVPEGVSLRDAAALPEVVCTVWSNVFLTASLQPGQTLLVHGGSSGIGTMAIQLAREIGAHVAVTAGSAAKLEACRELGAEILVNYREQDFVRCCAAHRRRRRRRGPGQHGREVPRPQRRGARDNGRLVVIGLQGGTRAELDLGALLRKRAAVVATSLRARPAAEKATIVAAVREHVWPLVARGGCDPIVHGTYPLAAPPTPTASWRPARTSARCCSLPDRGGQPAAALPGTSSSARDAAPGGGRSRRGF